jgi:hypothetical protein
VITSYDNSFGYFVSTGGEYAHFLFLLKSFVIVLVKGSVLGFQCQFPFAWSFFFCVFEDGLLTGFGASEARPSRLFGGESTRKLVSKRLLAKEAELVLGWVSEAQEV